MSRIIFQNEGDSTMNVTLPPPGISEVEIELDSVKEYMTKGKSLSLFLGGGGKKYTKIYDNISETLARTKSGVAANAVKNKILDETSRQARAYILNTANSFGFQVEFIPSKEEPDMSRIPKGLQKELEKILKSEDGGDKKSSLGKVIEKKGEEKAEKEARKKK